jgi:eukaryotic-like serine/threonine-protein kinase
MSDTMIGKQLGSFRIESQLGGETSRTFRAVNETTNQVVAIKIDGGEDATNLARFHRASEILQQFHHPNIIRLLASGRDQGTSYLVMEYVAGTSLAEVLAKRGALPFAEIVAIAIQICDALGCIHQDGIVHRNLKPSHLLLTEQDQVKLIGFEIAKILDAPALLTSIGRVIGTPLYMAPEQIRGAPPISHKTDLYALGAVLYQMLTGEPVFRGESSMALMLSHLNETPPTPDSRAPDVPPSMNELIGRLLAKDPADRPADATEVSNALLQIGQEGRIAVKKPVPPHLPQEPKHLPQGMWAWLFGGKFRRVIGYSAVHTSPSEGLWDRDLDAQ